MEPIRVDLHNWPHDRDARYVAPKIEAGTVDEHGRRQKLRFETHAYLVDLNGSASGLPDYERVLLHQVPPGGWWYIKAVDEEHLARIERYKVS